MNTLKLHFFTLAAVVLLTSATPGAGAPREERGAQEPQYLLFQLFTYLCDGSQAFDKQKSAKTINEILDSLDGQRGNGTNRLLGFAWGPLSLDQTDTELREIIREAFKVAHEKDVAVAFHIDDSMFWRRRPDLWKDPRNIEWSDWKGTPFPYRYVDWIAGFKLAPQMCYASPTLRIEVGRIAREVIGAEIKRGLDALKTTGKEQLFAGVMAGWETHLADFSKYGSKENIEEMRQDGAPRVRIGYHALSYLGFSEKNPPKDLKRELDGVVGDWAEFWAKELHLASISTNRIYSHFAFPDGKAFNRYSRPGFSVYNRSSLEGVLQALHDRQKPPWALAEGTNLDETFEGFLWEAYLARIFNHGGALANIFAWHEKEQSPYGRATTSKSALAAYKKFLEGETLSEEIRESDLSPAQRKARLILTRLPSYVQRGGNPGKVALLVQQLRQLASTGQSAQAEKIADEILALIDPIKQ
jgi:hypothetical protein